MSQPAAVSNRARSPRCADHLTVIWFLTTLGTAEARDGICVKDDPLVLDMVERHPDGSQAFLPMTHQPFLVVVAPDDGGTPGLPQAFLTLPGQGVNLRRGTWHGVLTPLFAPGLFAVVDRIAPEGEDPDANLEEHWLTTPVEVVAAQATALRS